MITFFHMSTTVGWALVMYQAVSQRGIDMEPSDHNQPLWSYFFICFMVIGSFFILNLFVGIVINTFNRQKEVLSKSFMLSSNKKEWLNFKNTMFNTKPKKVLSSEEDESIGLKTLCYHIQDHDYFDNFITLSICCNTILMTLYYAN
jgi:ABC-type glycerol-3-phosphate transport system permease component